MKGFVGVEKPFGHLNSGRSIQQHLDHDRGINNNHRPSRSSDGLSRRNRGCDRGSVGKTTSQFSDCWPLRDATDFLKEIVRQRQADESRSRFEFSMQAIRYVTKLNHLRHGHSLSACAQHVNSTTVQKCL